jgi:hypothetical protein
MSASDPNNFDALFFLGASDLLTGHLRDGIAELSRVARAGDRSPYAEESHYLMAKAWLQKADIPAARRELETVTAMNGDLRARAAAVLQRLQSL